MHSLLKPMISFIRIGLAAAIVVWMAGCADAPPEPVPESEDEALRLLAATDVRAFHDSFQALESVPHVAEFAATSERRNASPFLSTVRLRRDLDAGTYEVEAESSSGEIDDGIFARLHREPGAMDLDMLPSLFLEDDPPFLDSLGRTAFVYTVGGDSLIDGITVRMLDITRVPDEERGRPYESIRMYIADGALVGMDVEVDERTLFFSEQSRRRAVLRLGPGGSWLPRHVEVQSNIRNFLSPTRSVSGTWSIWLPHDDR